MKPAQPPAAVRYLEQTYKILLTVLGVGMISFHLYTAVAGVMAPMYQRGVHLAFGMALVFLIYPLFKKSMKRSAPVLIAGIVFSILALSANLYAVINSEAIAMRAGVIRTEDVVFGVPAILLLLEGMRRTNMWPLAAIAVVALVYFFIGPYIPGRFYHPGYDWELLLSNLYLSLEGIYGLILGVSATFVVLYILLASLLNEFKVGDFLFDLAQSILGHVRGGPAKVCVVSSALFGTTSGSGVADAVATGTFNIPLMKRVGYEPHFAAAVESTASAGGQMMPPIMGAAAFIMAEVLEVPYVTIMLAAIIPSILYYLAVYLQVDGEAVKLSLAGLPRETLPRTKEVLLRRGHLLTPLVVLVVLLAVVGWSPMRAAFWAVVAAALVTLIKKETRWTPMMLLRGLAKAGREAAQIAVLCATAGVVVGILSVTGLGVDLTSIVVELSGGIPIVLFLLAMVICLILGMGLPPVACYVLLAALVAPAMVQQGVNPLAAHLFIFYFGMLALVTPPVANSAYVCAGIAGASPMKTMFVSTRLAIGGLILPFFWIYHPGLLFQAPVQEILLAVVFASFGVVASASAFEGYLGSKKLNVMVRLILVGAAFLVIFPGFTTSVIGVVIVAVVAAFMMLRKPKGRLEVSK